MRKEILIIFGVFSLAFRAAATMSVIDHAHIAQDAANEVVNLVRCVQTGTKDTETALNTLRTYENTVLQVARMGDPAALRSLPGVSTVAELYQMYGEATRDYQQLQSLINPRRYQTDLNYILSAYQQPAWNGFRTASGFNFVPNQGLFQFPVSDYNVAQTVQEQLAQLDQKKRMLTQQRDQALKGLQSATTVSDVQKYHAALDALNAAMADVNLERSTTVQSRAVNAVAECCGSANLPELANRA
jgi:hypothetical protein